MKLKLQKFIATLILSLTLVISSPLYALAEAPQAPSAPEAPQAPSAPEASPAPQPPTESPSPSPSPEPEQNTASNDNGYVGDNTGSEPPNGSEYSGTSATNDGNGSDSTNDSTSSTENNLDIDATNTATVLNNADLAVVTGDNNASYNTGGPSSITTGDATLGAVVSSSVNSTEISGSGANCCPGSASATNKDNGSTSTNNATATSKNDTNVDIGNDALIQTEIVGLSLSGSNDASFNTGGDSEIITGDANLAATVITDANAVSLGIYQFDVASNQNGDIILTTNPANCLNCAQGSTLAENSGNGADSQNSSTASSENNIVETINNEGDIVNNINLDAITGDNKASYNTGGDSIITTGDANVVANVINSLNTVVDGIIYTVNIFGDLVGNILLPEQQIASDCGSCCGGDVTAANIGNGADSTNNATATATNNSTTTQTNNATLYNNIDIDANTGGNDVNFNTGGDSVIETGEVNVDANVINVANVNVASNTCDPVYMVFINDPSGNWQGQIIGAAPGTYFYTSDGLIYVVGQDGNLIAVNSENGAGSTNSATATTTNNTTVTQNNTGTVTNNINIDANTGDNKASYNTNGNSNITTGDANIFVNVVNFINSNFSGRKVVMTLVNVFGSWIGHFVPPGFSAPDSQNAQNSPSVGGSSGGSSNSNANGSNNQPSSSVSTGNLASSALKSKLQGLIGGFRTEKIVTDDNSISPISQSIDSDSAVGGLPLGIKILFALVPALILGFLLRRRFSPS